jgi:hypothetical protein
MQLIFLQSMPKRRDRFFRESNRFGAPASQYYFGSERLIMIANDDPEWVHELLLILQRRKLGFIQSLAGAHYDILEFGGGDASASVISPRKTLDLQRVKSRQTRSPCQPKIGLRSKEPARCGS